MTINPIVAALAALVVAIAVVVLALFPSGLAEWLRIVLLLVGILVASGLIGAVVKTLSGND